MGGIVSDCYGVHLGHGKNWEMFNFSESARSLFVGLLYSQGSCDEPSKWYVLLEHD